MTMYEVRKYPNGVTEVRLANLDVPLYGDEGWEWMANVEAPSPGIAIDLVLGSDGFLRVGSQEGGDPE